MADGHNSEISVQIGGRRVCVCGSEKFVMEKFQELANEYLSRDDKIDYLATDGGKSFSMVTATNASNSGIDKLCSVDSETGKISIHGMVPGDTKSERMKNVALIALLRAASGDSVSSAVIRDTCADQACLDSSNFAAVFKKDKRNFIVTGKGAEWSIKLTVFGEQKAREVLKEMFNG